MKPPPFRYLSADTEQGVLDALAEYGDEAKVLAGGRCLVPPSTSGWRAILVIDLELVDTIRGIERRDGTFVGRHDAPERGRALGGSAGVLPVCRSGPRAGRPPQIRIAEPWVGASPCRPRRELPAVALALRRRAGSCAARRGSCRSRRRSSSSDRSRTVLGPDELLIRAVPGHPRSSDDVPRARQEIG